MENQKRQYFTSKVDISFNLAHNFRYCKTKKPKVTSTGDITVAFTSDKKKSSSGAVCKIKCTEKASGGSTGGGTGGGTGL